MPHRKVPPPYYSMGGTRWARGGGVHYGGPWGRFFILLPGGTQKAIGPAKATYSTQGSLPDAPVAAFGALECAFKHSKVTQYARAMCIKTLTNLKGYGSHVCRVGNWHR